MLVDLIFKYTMCKLLILVFTVVWTTEAYPLGDPTDLLDTIPTGDSTPDLLTGLPLDSGGLPGGLPLDSVTKNLPTSTLLEDSTPLTATDISSSSLSDAETSSGIPIVTSLTSESKPVEGGLSDATGAVTKTVFVTSSSSTGSLDSAQVVTSDATETLNPPVGKSQLPNGVPALFSTVTASKPPVLAGGLDPVNTLPGVAGVDPDSSTLPLVEDLSDPVGTSKQTVPLEAIESTGNVDSLPMDFTKILSPDVSPLRDTSNILNFVTSTSGADSSTLSNVPILNTSSPSGGAIDPVSDIVPALSDYSSGGPLEPITSAFPVVQDLVGATNSNPTGSALDTVSAIPALSDSSSVGDLVPIDSGLPGVLDSAGPIGALGTTGSILPVVLAAGEVLSTTNKVAEPLDIAKPVVPDSVIPDSGSLPVVGGLLGTASAAGTLGDPVGTVIPAVSAVQGVLSPDNGALPVLGGIVNDDSSLGGAVDTVGTITPAVLTVGGILGTTDTVAQPINIKNQAAPQALIPDNSALPVVGDVLSTTNTAGDALGTAVGTVTQTVNNLPVTEGIGPVGDTSVVGEPLNSVVSPVLEPVTKSELIDGVLSTVLPTVEDVLNTANPGLPVAGGTSEPKSEEVLNTVSQGLPVAQGVSGSPVGEVLNTVSPAIPVSGGSSEIPVGEVLNTVSPAIPVSGGSSEIPVGEVLNTVSPAIPVAGGTFETPVPVVGNVSESTDPSQKVIKMPAKRLIAIFKLLARLKQLGVI